MTGLLDRIMNALANNCIVESGTNNLWKYKKYADGTYEATYTKQHTQFNVAAGPSTGEYYSGDLLIAARPSFAKTVDGALGTPFAGSMTSGPRVYRITVDSNNDVRVQFRTQSSVTNASTQVAYKMWGTWK